MRPLSLFYSDTSADGVEERSLSLARSAQAERDNESCFFVRAAGGHRLTRRCHVKIYRGIISYHAKLRLRKRVSSRPPLRVAARVECRCGGRLSRRAIDSANENGLNLTRVEIR
ncbi:hypothetical protein EVAR_26432_1 [Eumeta japonica]|uniref:Uncharacterized protein n=1 Tax=Eumeta variegata TaxID=151549 RepID=A0A4C1VNU2_EUMVA|nr:hypothetical protein EVAR_26432_1 [Eumeta japonica]